MIQPRSQSSDLSDLVEKPSKSKQNVNAGSSLSWMCFFWKTPPWMEKKNWEKSHTVACGKTNHFYSRHVLRIDTSVFWGLMYKHYVICMPHRHIHYNLSGVLHLSSANKTLHQKKKESTLNSAVTTKQNITKNKSVKLNVFNARCLSCFLHVVRGKIFWLGVKQLKRYEVTLFPVTVCMSPH